MTSSGRRRPLLTTALLAALGLGLGACSGEVSVGSDDAETVTKQTLEDQVAENITGEGSEDVEVTCDGDLTAEVGASQDCLATLDGTSTGIRLTVDAVNEDDVDYSSTFFITADDLATAVQDYYTGQGLEIDDTTCDGELLGDEGSTASCDVTSQAEGDATIGVTSTGVDGLSISFDLEVVDGGE